MWSGGTQDLQASMERVHTLQILGNVTGPDFITRKYDFRNYTWFILGNVTGQHNITLGNVTDQLLEKWLPHFINKYD